MEIPEHGCPSDLWRMETHVHIEKAFDQVQWSGHKVPGREFEDCTFTRCDFSNSDFSRSRFTGCTFTDCNLALVKLADAGLHKITFNRCKLLGIDFSRCKEMLFSVAFNDCMLDHAVFHQRKMGGTRFTRCSLKGVDFEGAQLGNAVFERCDLERAVFVNTQLQQADFSSAYNISLDPERNKLKGARFSVDGALALLAKYGIEVG